MKLHPTWQRKTYGWKRWGSHGLNVNPSSDSVTYSTWEYTYEFAGGHLFSALSCVVLLSQQFHVYILYLPNESLSPLQRGTVSLNDLVFSDRPSTMLNIFNKFYMCISKILLNLKEAPVGSMSLPAINLREGYRAQRWFGGYLRGLPGFTLCLRWLPNSDIPVTVFNTDS